ncbi:MAG TPA: winged helix DNA-binding domain-containing protein [Ktedonobacterales bacterium]|nr:winged helix DNA-binding domain-containing protein [Ktedonobacterales bacterium]
MTTDITERRLLRQRLIRPDLATPAEVVRWFGAVQAQELPGANYAVACRMFDRAPAVTEQVIEQAIADRSIVRTWPMRGTLHFIPAADAQWMLRLLARRTNQKAASIYRRVGLSDADFARAGEALASALRGGKLMTRKNLYATLEAADLATAGDQRGGHLLGYWAREGLICLGPRQGKQPTFTLLDEWVPNARQLSDDEALATLARRYYRSHGPATERDFAWWSGLTLTEARRGIALAGADLTRMVIEGQPYWEGAAPLPPAETSAGHGARVLLLPQYDEYTVAYRDRSAALHPTFPADPFLILGPVLVVDGQVVGTWKRALAKDAVTLTITHYAPLNAAQRAGLTHAAERYGRYLGLPARVELRPAGG